MSRPSITALTYAPSMHWSSGAAEPGPGPDTADGSDAERRQPPSATRHAPRVCTWMTPWAWAVTVGGSFAYVALVMRYAVNMPQGDEQVDEVLIAVRTLSGGLTLDDLWSQLFNESRLFVSNSIFALDARLGSLDIRTIIFLDALLLVLSLALVLALHRSFSSRTVTAVTAIVLTAICLNPDGMYNALWAYQIQLYLTTFFILLMMVALDRAARSGAKATAWTVGAGFCAAAATCSTIDGLAAWPLGLLVIAWSGGGLRAARTKLVAWGAAGVVAFGLYFVHYNVAEASAGCLAGPKLCSSSYAAHHPGVALRFFLSVVGNVVPVPSAWIYGSSWAGGVSVTLHQVLGAVILVVAAYVCVRCVRERVHRVGAWIPFSLVVMGIGLDAVITVGRSGAGDVLALSGHYTTPQLFVLSGIACWVLEYARVEAADAARRRRLSSWALPVTLLAAVLFALSIVTGLSDARFSHAVMTTQARIAVNLDELPAAARPCYARLFAFDYLSGKVALESLQPLIDELRTDRLSAFSQPAYGYYRSIGLPPAPGCPH